MTWRNWITHGRVAQPGTTKWNLAKTALQIVAMWSTFLGVLPAFVYWLEGLAGLEAWRFGGYWPWIGVALFALASAAGLQAGFMMSVLGWGTPLPLDAPRRLVIRGFYRHVRNPMAIFGLTQGFGVGLYLGSPAVLVYVVLGVLAWNYVARPWEERDLERRFGDVYRLYRRRVRCWRPRWRPYDPAREDREPPLSAERTTAPGRWLVLYDGHCAFCRARADTIARLVSLERDSLVDVHDAARLASLPGISLDACMQAMHTVTPEGGVFAGPEAIALVLRRHALWGTLARLYHVPGLRLLCDWAYALVARYRYKLGTCPDGACAVNGGADR